MSFEVATAHVSIFPKFASGFGGQVKQQFGDSGKAAGGTFSDTLKAILLGGAIGKVVGGVAGILKAGFQGGIARALNIEEAKAKLSGLGHTTEGVTAIMSDALAAVKGTAFGMGDAAAVAASTVAAGVKPGQDLQRTLKLVGDAATIAGTGMGEMGSVFNKVAASNKLQMDSVNQLQDRGIPILALVAKELGVTQEEAAKLASQGKVSFDIFQKAMESGLGGAALKSGETFRGALANTKAAIGRIVADFAAPAMDGLRQVFIGAIPAIDAFGAILKPASKAFGEWVNNLAPKVAAGIGKLPGIFEAAGAGIATLTARLQPVREVLAFLAGEAVGGIRAFAAAFAAADGDVTSVGFPGFMERLANTLRTALSGARAAVAGFVEGFGGIDTVVSTFQGLLPLLMGPLGIVKSALMEVFSGGGGIDFGALGRTIGSSLGPILKAVSELARTLVTVLAGALAQVMPVLLSLGGTVLSVAGQLAAALLPVLAELASTLLPVIASLFAQLVPVVASLVSTIAPLIGMLVAQLAPALVQLVGAVLPPLVGILSTVVEGVMAILRAVMPLVTTLLSTLVPAIVMIVSSVLPPLAGLLAEVANLIVTLVVPVIVTLVEILMAVLVPAIQFLLPIVTTVFSAIAAIIGAVMTVVQGIIRTVTGLIRGDWTAVWSGIKMIFSGVWDAIKAIVLGALNIIKAVIEGGMNAARSIFMSIWNGLVSWVMAIPSRILGAIAGLAQLAGKAAEYVGGFVRNARAKFDEAVAFVKGIPSRILAALGNLGSTLLNAGSSLIGGFVQGIRNAFGGAVEAVQGGLSKLRALFPFSPAKIGPFSGRGYTSHSGRALMRDFADAMTAESTYLSRAADRALSGIRLDVPFTASAAFTAAGAGAPGSGGPAQTVVNVELAVSDLAGLRMVEDFVAMLDVRALQARGVSL